MKQISMRKQLHSGKKTPSGMYRFREGFNTKNVQSYGIFHNFFRIFFFFFIKNTKMIRKAKTLIVCKQVVSILHIQEVLWTKYQVGGPLLKINIDDLYWSRQHILKFQINQISDTKLLNDQIS